MAYAHRPIHDADAHVMETPEWLEPWADPGIRDRLPALFLASVKPGEERMIDTFRRRHADPAYRAEDAEKILLRKN
ncbi:MAG: amidohydrolase, partial [Deltaproteobacteria bacterium]|nr:amidohydrolase [Deltaproteobacteria bacterium]